MSQTIISAINTGIDRYEDNYNKIANTVIIATTTLTIAYVAIKFFREAEKSFRSAAAHFLPPITFSAILLLTKEIFHEDLLFIPVFLGECIFYLAAHIFCFSKLQLKFNREKKIEEIVKEFKKLSIDDKRKELAKLIKEADFGVGDGKQEEIQNVNRLLLTFEKDEKHTLFDLVFFNKQDHKRKSNRLTRIFDNSLLKRFLYLKKGQVKEPNKKAKKYHIHKELTKEMIYSPFYKNSLFEPAFRQKIEKDNLQLPEIITLLEGICKGLGYKKRGKPEFEETRKMPRFCDMSDITTACLTAMNNIEHGEVNQFLEQSNQTKYPLYGI